MSITEGPFHLRKHSSSPTGLPEQDNTESGCEKTCDSYKTHSNYSESILDNLDGMDEDCLLGGATVMESKDIQESESVIEPPALPERSHLRASRFLGSNKPTPINTSTPSLIVPHNIYLSSEDESSSSADDFSDFDYDTESDGSQEPSLARTSHEESAKIVSVVFSGKPCIVELSSPKRAESRPSSHDYLSSNESLPLSHPSRNSSRLSTKRSYSRLSFLSKDPFAESSYTLESCKEEETDAAAAPRIKDPMAVLTRIHRTFSLAKKRSQQRLAHHHRPSETGNSLASLASTSSLHVDRTKTPIYEDSRPSKLQAEKSASPPSPEAIKPWKRSNTTDFNQSPMTPPASATSLKKGFWSGIKMNRRQSMRV